MAKMNSWTGHLYEIGTALTTAGFILPIFRLSGFFGGIAKGLGKLGGKSHGNLINGFSIISNTNDTAMKIAALLLFIGAAAGLIVSVLKSIKNKNLIQIIALVVSVAAGLYIFFNTGDYGVKFAAKYLFIGFYMIVIGWLAAAAGLFLNHK